MAVNIMAEHLIPFGVKIDLDLRNDLRDEDIQVLREMFLEHHLIVFPKQRLSYEQQQKFIACFGPVLDSGKEFKLVSNVVEGAALGSVELGLHSDLSYTSDPYLGISLHAIEVDDGRTSTFFQDNTRAYYMLTEERKNELKDCKVRMVFTSYTSKRNTYDPELPSYIHPLIATNPMSGQPILFVNELHAAEIIGLPAEESKILLDELCAAARVGNIYEHIWQTGDLVFWDNRALAHGRGAVSDKPRTLQRVVMARSGPRDLNPDFEIADLDYGNGGRLKLRKKQ